MSDPLPTLVGMSLYHPWRELRHRPDWTLVWRDLPGDLLGLTHFATRTIELHVDLLQTERRCALTHELVHQERGGMPCDPLHGRREEIIVRKETARRLIAWDHLLDALAWAQYEDLEAAADALWVTRTVLDDRLRWLHPSRAGLLARRMREFHGHD